MWDVYLVYVKSCSLCYYCQIDKFSLIQLYVQPSPSSLFRTFRIHSHAYFPGTCCYFLARFYSFFVVAFQYYQPQEVPGIPYVVT